jgi:hypothetical protein
MRGFGSRGEHADLWYPRSRVRSRPKPSDFSGENILSMPSFAREVKPFAPCRRLLKTPKWPKKASFRQKLPGHSRSQFHLSLLGALALMETLRHLAAKVGTSKGKGEKWQTTPKNLLRTQRTRVISVAWLGSGCWQNRPKGWILIIIINIIHRHSFLMDEGLRWFFNFKENNILTLFRYLKFIYTVRTSWLKTWALLIVGQIYVVCLRSSVNGTRKQTKQKIQTN